MSAVLASILEIPLEEIPNFYDEGPTEAHWHAGLNKWLESRGIALIPVSLSVSDASAVRALRGYAIASGPSPRDPKLHHATVWKDGKIIHDPSPGGTGLDEIHLLEFIYPLDPSRLKALDVSVPPDRPDTVHFRGIDVPLQAALRAAMEYIDRYPPEDGEDQNANAVIARALLGLHACDFYRAIDGSTDIQNSPEQT